MRTFLVYLQLELKRTIKSISYFLAGAIVLSLLAGTIAFSAAGMLYGERAVGNIPVGVVVPKEDVLAAKAMRMVESLDSVNSLCDFTYLEESEGLEGLKKGEFFALMKLPDGLVEGIMDGTNLPVTVVFPENAGLEASVFRELTEAGSSILSTSQAGIYAADEYLWQHGMEVYVPKAEEDLNRLFLSYALDRDVYFRKKEVSAAGKVGTAAYFAISMSVLVLLLLGIPAAPLMRPDSEALRQKLKLFGIQQWKQVLVRQLCLTFLLLLVSAVPVLFCMKQRVLGSTLAAAGLWLLLCLTASGWILMFYEVCRNSAAAILFLFITTVVMVFLAGGIVPSVFLPDIVQKAGSIFPASFLMDGVRLMVTGAGTGKEMLAPAAKLLGTAAVCFLVSVKAGEGE